MPSALERLRQLYLAHLSLPSSNRPLYRLIGRQRTTNIVEVGLGSLKRACRVIWLARVLNPGATVRYTAIDAFELRPPGQDAALSLKEAYRSLKPTGAVLRLLPGEPQGVLSRVANELTGTDLVIISARYEAAALEGAWFYLPRMLHERSAVLVEEAGRPGAVALRRCAPMEVRERAAANSRRRAA